MRLASIRSRLRQLSDIDPVWRSPTALAMWLAAFLLTSHVYLLATMLRAVVRSLASTVAAVESALIFFPLLVGCLVPAGMRLVETYGRRRAALSALIAFAAGLAVAVASSSVAMLVAGYALIAGLAGAALLACAWSLLEEASDPTSRTIGTALLGTAPLAGTVVGPFVGGLVTQETTWRLGLLLELAPIALIFWIMWRSPRTTAHSRARIVSVADLVVVGGLVAVLAGVELGDDYGWWSATTRLSAGSVPLLPLGLSPVPLLIGAGTVSVVLSILWTARAGLMGRSWSHLVAALLIAIGIGTTTMGAIYALLLFFSVGTRLDQLETGLAVMPFGLGAILINIAVTRSRTPTHDRLGAGVGIGLSAAGIGLLLWGLQSWAAGWGSAPGLFVLGLGNGLALNRISRLATTAAAPTMNSVAGAINAGASDLAYSLGIAIFGAVFVGVAAHAIVGGVEQRLGASLPPEVRQQVVARLEDDLRTLTPEEHDAFVESQPRPVRSALRSAAAEALSQGIGSALETALAGLGFSLVVLVLARPPARAG